MDIEVRYEAWSELKLAPASIWDEEINHYFVFLDSIIPERRDRKTHTGSSSYQYKPAAGSIEGLQNVITHYPAGMLNPQRGRFYLPALGLGKSSGM